MAVLINGMEMPKSCDVCPFMNANDDLSVEDYRYMYCDFPGIGEFVTDYEESRHPDCPLIKVPERHWRLIDQDAILKEVIRGDYPNQWIDKNELNRLFRNAPTIIPASEEKT